MSRQVIHGQFRKITERAGLGRDWQPRELRHSWVSLLSDAGVSIEDIADAAGHINSNITKIVYRHQISDKLTRASAAMDRINIASGGTARRP